MLHESAVTDGSLRQLRDLGVQLVVDDFGTGFSALEYFKRFAIQGLKIDRSFIDGLGRSREDTAIVTATLAFASALGLSVTAEGVETADQLDRLRALGCPRPRASCSPGRCQRPRSRRCSWPPGWIPARVRGGLGSLAGGPATGGPATWYACDLHTTGWGATPGGRIGDGCEPSLHELPVRRDLGGGTRHRLRGGLGERPPDRRRHDRERAARSM